MEVASPGKDAARKLKKAMDDNNYIARRAFDSFTPAEVEVDHMMTDVQSFLDVYASLSEIPWQTSKISAMRQARANAIRKYAGIQPDGRPVPLSTLEWLWYGSAKNKLIAKINSARAGAKGIEANLKLLGEGEMQNRDTMLLQYFILEQFTLFKQFILLQQMFVFSLSSPLPIDPLIWTVSWLIIIGAQLFFLYWALAWGVSQGGTTFASWLINLSFSVAQDIFAVQIFRVYIIYIVSMVSIKPQLKYIYRVLNRVAVSYAQDELEDNLEEIRVVQYISPACRAARLSVTYKQATANILRHINDTDIEQCRLRYETSMSTIVVIALAIPVLAAVLGETVGDEALKSIIPPCISAILVMNYRFYLALGLLILIPYLSFVFAVVWLIRLRVRHKELEKERREAEKNAIQHAGVKKWNAATRSQLNTTSSVMLFYSAARMFLGHYWSRPVDFIQLSLMQLFYKPEENKKSPQVWSMMNFPQELQATTQTREADSVVIEVNRSRSVKGARPEIVEARSIKSSNMGTERTDTSVMSNIPEEVLRQRTKEAASWLSLWRTHRYAEDIVSKPVLEGSDDRAREYLPRGYVIGMLNKRLMNAHVPQEFEGLGDSLNQLPDMQLRMYLAEHEHDASSVLSGVESVPDMEGVPVLNERTSSSVVVKFREKHTIVYNGNDALSRLLRDYRRLIRSKKVLMIDEDEREALLYKPINTCNVLIGYNELRRALAEVWDLFHPGGVELSEDEREEVLFAFDTWIVKHGQSFLHRHYHQHISRVETATLARLKSLRTKFDPVLALSAPDVPSEADKAHFSVPFQSFRVWFLRTCSNIERYRALQGHVEGKKLQPRNIKIEKAIAK
jgi:hypothetical protein